MKCLLIYNQKSGKQNDRQHFEKEQEAGIASGHAKQE